MRTFLLFSSLAIVAIVTPVASLASGGQPSASFSQSRSTSEQFSRSADVRIHRHHDRDNDSAGFARDDRRGRSTGEAYFGEREYQGDTLWRSNGFNDWWHDRPDRAFPRWVSTNQNCERQWWAGSGWRC